MSIAVNTTKNLHSQLNAKRSHLNEKSQYLAHWQQHPHLLDPGASRFLGMDHKLPVHHDTYTPSHHDNMIQAASKNFKGILQARGLPPPLFPR
jgi:hypothetical protein